MFEWRIHPEDAKLLRFCEGELTARETYRVESHVQVCWQCRTHVDEIKKTIAEYVRYRKETLKPSLPSPPAPWRSLSGDLQRLRDEKANGPGFVIMRRPFSWMLVGIAAIAASAAAVYLTKPNPRVPPAASAQHELKRALPAEHRHVATAQSKPIVEETRGSHRQSVGPDDELKVIAALHQIGADLGDPVSVVREPDKIVVSGAGLEGKRLEEIRSSIAELPNVIFELTPPASNPAEPSAPVAESGRSSPIQEEIARQFNNQAAYQQFVDRSLETSEAIMARAHALRTLAYRFPPNVEAQLSASGTDLLASLRDQHTGALIDKVQQIDDSLRPLLEALGVRPNPPEPTPMTNWQDATYELFAMAQKVDRLVGSMVAPSSSIRLTDSTPTETAAALSQLKTRALAYRRLSVDGQTKGGR